MKSIGSRIANARHAGDHPRYPKGGIMKCRFGILLLLLTLFPPLVLANEADSSTPLLQEIEAAAHAQGPSTAEGLGIPAPLWKSCTATQVCSNGCEISCQGPNTNSVCSSTTNSVTCDGVKTTCPYPNCVVSTSCLDRCGYCACKAAGGTGGDCLRSFCQ